MGRYLENLIRQGENQMLDFKYEISDSKKISRTLAAFANTDGGKLLVGVKDNGNIAGAESDEEYYMVEAAATLHCKPGIAFEFKKWTTRKGKSVLEITIPKAEKKPVLARTDNEKWMAYTRVDDQNILANSVMLRVWKKEQNREGTLIRYRKEEEWLFEYFRTHNDITLPLFSKLAGISKKKAETIIVNLVLVGLLDIVPTERSFYYKPSTANVQS